MFFLWIKFYYPKCQFNKLIYTYFLHAKLQEHFIFYFANFGRKGFEPRISYLIRDLKYHSSQRLSVKSILIHFIAWYHFFYFIYIYHMFGLLYIIVRVENWHRFWLGRVYTWFCLQTFFFFFSFFVIVVVMWYTYWSCSQSLSRMHFQSCITMQAWDEINVINS